MKKKFIFILAILVLLSGIACLILLNKIDNKRKENHSVDEVLKETITEYDDYVYKIKKGIGMEGYIYLFSNNDIKVITKDEVYAVEEGCNCLKPTGEIIYKNFDIKFSPSNMVSAINVINEIGASAKKKDINADTMELTDYQSMVLLSLILNNEPIMDEAKQVNE